MILLILTSNVSSKKYLNDVGEFSKKFPFILLYVFLGMTALVTTKMILIQRMFHPFIALYFSEPPYHINIHKGFKDQLGSATSWHQLQSLAVGQMFPLLWNPLPFLYCPAVTTKKAIMLYPLHHISLVIKGWKKRKCEINPFHLSPAYTCGSISGAFAFLWVLWRSGQYQMNVIKHSASCAFINRTQARVSRCKNMHQHKPALM